MGFIDATGAKGTVGSAGATGRATASGATARGGAGLAIPAPAVRASGLAGAIGDATALMPGAGVLAFTAPAGTSTTAAVADNGAWPAGAAGGAVDIALSTSASNRGVRSSEPRGPGIVDTGTCGNSADVATTISAPGMLRFA